MKKRILAAESDDPSRLLILPMWILAAFAIGWLMNEAATLCLWIVCAFFLFVLLDPMAEFLKTKRWPTLLASILLVLVSTVLAAGALSILAYLFSDVVAELEQSQKFLIHSFESLTTSWNTLIAKIPSLHPSTPDAISDVSKVQIVQSSQIGGEFGGRILHGVGSAATILTFSLLTPILAFFFLAERDNLGRILARAYVKAGRGHITWQKIVHSTRAFFVGNLILAVITYPLFIIVFRVFGVPSLFATAALATFFNIIPFAGSVLSGFLPAIALYTQNQNMSGPLALYGCCVAIHFIIADFVTPKLLGAQVNINATTSTIALVAWGELWGGIGLILAIPLTSLIKILFENSSFFWLQWLAGLMSEDVDSALGASADKD